MEQFIQTLLTMTATASVAAVCVMLLRLPLKRAPRWITCCLWLVVFLRMVCPTGLALPVSLVPQAISDGASVERILPAAQEADPVTTPSPPVESIPDTQAGETTTAAVTQTTTPATEFAAPVWPAVLTGIWAVGVAAALLWAGISYARLRRRIADAVRVEGNIYETDRIDTPFVCGVFRPRIYLPVTLDEADRRYVLLHEQAHLRRRDHWAKPLAYLALCLHWFNPILWLCYRLLCRDIETACDQAVIRSFDRADTAQYAAALLHLGQGPALPTVVPLAFGEENATGRVRSVLSYQKPAFWAVLAAVVACVVAGVLLLADRAQPPAQLEGREIAQASVVETLSYSGWYGDSPDFPTNVTLPEDLTQDLVALLDQTDHGNFIYVPAPQSFPDRTVTLPSADGAATYYFAQEDGELALYRVLSDPMQSTWRRAVLDGALAESQAYQDWKNDLEYYLAIGRADELYPLKVRHIGDPNDVRAILDALCFEDVVGSYEVQFQTEEAPYGVQLLLEIPAPQDDAHLAAMDDYLVYVGFVLLSLLDNADRVECVFSDTAEPIRIPYGLTKEDDPHLDAPSLVTFRQTFAIHHGDVTPYSPGKPVGRCYRAETFLYFDPSQVELPQATEKATQTLYKGLHFVLGRDNFALRLGDQETGCAAFYDSDPDDSSLLSPLVTAPDGQTFDLSAPEGEVNYIHAVKNRETGEDTGYRWYQEGSSTYVAYFRLDGGKETLVYLVKVTLDPS